MKKSQEVKEKIIEATICLISESDGNLATINTRAIADKAQVGIGLINYHFQTKENLIEICVERMIGRYIFKISPSVLEQAPVSRLKHTAKRVFDLLMDNPAISRIFILSDQKNPKIDDNTVKSALGICKVLGDVGIPKDERFVLSFALISIIQTLFLRKDQSGELFGHDINVKKQRDDVLNMLIDTMFGKFDG